MSRYDSTQRKYQPTASRMTSGSNCRHLKRAETEGVSRSMELAYQITPATLQHLLKRSWYEVPVIGGVTGKPYESIGRDTGLLSTVGIPVYADDRFKIVRGN